MTVRRLNIGFDTNKFLPNDQTKQYFAEEGFGGMFINLVNQGISSRYPNGIPFSLGKTLANIQEKALELPKDTATIDLEDAEFALIRKVFGEEQSGQPGETETRFGWGQVRLAKVYSDALLSAQPVDTTKA